MLKKELAAALGISPAMVSKLAKRGMPVDSVERARRWRKRHLDPGRVKGQRMGTHVPAEAMPDVARPQSLTELRSLVESLGATYASALANRADEVGLLETRSQLRAAMRRYNLDTHGRGDLIMPAPVWADLVGYLFTPFGCEKKMLNLAAHAGNLNTFELSRVVGDRTNADLACEYVRVACDWSDWEPFGPPHDVLAAYRADLPVSPPS